MQLAVKFVFIFLGRDEGWGIRADQEHVLIGVERKSPRLEPRHYGLRILRRWLIGEVRTAKATPWILSCSGASPLQRNVYPLPDSWGNPTSSSLVSASEAMSTLYLASSIAISAVHLSGLVL